MFLGLILYHLFPVVAPPSQYDYHHDIVVSGDQSGMVEYWSGPGQEYGFPKAAKFQHKIDTDLYEFAKVHPVYGTCTCTCIVIEDDGKQLTMYSICPNVVFPQSSDYSIVFLLPL